MNIAELLNPKNDYVFKRIFGYTGNEEITKGLKQYEKLKRCIVILIADYNIKKLKEIPEYVTKWQIREEKYTKIILTNVLELYIIETEKAKNIKGNINENLYNWIKFINNPEEESEMENKEIKQARKVLEEISQKVYINFS